jgi:hypothetical protein
MFARGFRALSTRALPHAAAALAIVGRANGRMTAEAVDDRLHEYDEVVYE